MVALLFPPSATHVFNMNGPLQLQGQCVDCFIPVFSPIATLLQSTITPSFVLTVPGKPAVFHANCCMIMIYPVTVFPVSHK